MIWIFAAVVLILAVLHEGFRKIVYVCAAIAAVIVFIGIGGFNAFK
jgi:hypothetical protein